MRPRTSAQLSRWWSACAGPSSATAAPARSRRSTAPKAPRASGSPWNGCLAGLDTLGVERDTAMQVVLSVALDSVPPLRRRAYDCVCKYRNVETADVAIALGLPTVTVRRVLEDLAAYGLVTGNRRARARPTCGTAPIGRPNNDRPPPHPTGRVPSPQNLLLRGKRRNSQWFSLSFKLSHIPM